MSADFLRDLTPPMPAVRTEIPLDSFDWRVETDADRLDFASVLKGAGKWEKIHIPHYSGPLGRVSTVYRTEFDVSPAMLSAAVRRGAKAIFLELPKGTYRIAGDPVEVDDLRRGLYFVSRDTGDPMVAGFGPDDFRFWYDASMDRPSPLMKAGPFTAGGWKPILLHGTSMAAGWRHDGEGAWCIVQIELAGRIAGNPVAEIFSRRLLSDDSLK